MQRHDQLIGCACEICLLLRPLGVLLGSSIVAY
jgi:hypothetical protein